MEFYKTEILRMLKTLCKEDLKIVYLFLRKMTGKKPGT